MNRDNLPHDALARPIFPDSHVNQGDDDKRETWFLEALYRLGDEKLACSSSGTTEAWVVARRETHPEFDERLKQWRLYRLEEVAEHVRAIALGKLEITTAGGAMMTAAGWKHFLMVHAQHPELLPGMSSLESLKLPMGGVKKVHLSIEYEEKPCQLP